MRIKINDCEVLETKHSLEEIADLMKQRTIEISNNNIINWKNVWSIEVLK